MILTHNALGSTKATMVPTIATIIIQSVYILQQKQMGSKDQVVILYAISNKKLSDNNLSKKQLITQTSFSQVIVPTKYLKLTLYSQGH